MNRHSQLLKCAIVVISAIGTRSLAAQDPTSATCTAHEYFSTGIGSNFTYYLNGTHQFPATAHFTLSGWSNIALSYSSYTQYPYDPKVSDDGHAILQSARIGVLCWHYAAGYDTAEQISVGGSAQQYLAIAEDCSESPRLHRRARYVSTASET